MSFLITIFARKEPTTDSVAIQHGLGHKKDVVFYKDADCKTFFGRWTWAHTPPRKNTKTVTLNCFPWAVDWLPDMEVAQ